ncbi:DUF3027 domain-containing protein [Kineosporia succinea]|uniref:DUF3027 family protein n=1 Tax=Kineosporia succinea TaxID=84632 RepID=A0ABT9NZR7_9ACTN|nr:DUF3027 domain-containing protein [Kineosporia succinea]MDP9825918.1 hypothetical protein [Kineosporia succinea]
MTDQQMTATVDETDAVAPEQTEAQVDAPVRVPSEPDPLAAAAVDIARQAAEDVAQPGTVGRHLSVSVDQAGLTMHAFDCTSKGYRGWRWAVTLAHVPGSDRVTVCDTVLLPGAESIMAPDWVPWSDRIAPGDLGAGDELPYKPSDPNLVPGYTVTDEDDSDQQLFWELGLGRERVLGPEGVASAADRWHRGSHGPTADTAVQASAACVSCAYFVPLSGSLRQAFGACANEWSPADGSVVAVDFGCGAHSETDLEMPAPEPLGDHILDETVVDRMDLAEPEPAPGIETGSSVDDVEASAVTEASEDTGPGGAVASPEAGVAGVAGDSEVAGGIEDVVVAGDARVTEDVVVAGDARVTEDVVVAGDARVTEDVVVAGVVDETVADDVVADETVADETVADDVVVGEAVGGVGAGESAAGESAADESAADEAVAVGGVVADETVADQVTVDGAVADGAGVGGTVVEPRIPRDAGGTTADLVEPETAPPVEITVESTLDPEPVASPEDSVQVRSVEASVDSVGGSVESSEVESSGAPEDVHVLRSEPETDQAPPVALSPEAAAADDAALEADRAAEEAGESGDAGGPGESIEAAQGQAVDVTGESAPAGAVASETAAATGDSDSGFLPAGSTATDAVPTEIVSGGAASAEDEAVWAAGEAETASDVPGEQAERRTEVPPQS